MVRIARYEDTMKLQWNSFSASAANATFLHQRHYMDYHRDRFIDHSLLFYEQEKLIAVLPCNEKENCLHSHGGLTYGGMLTQAGTRTTHIIDAFTALAGYLRENGLDGLFYKPVPSIFHRHRTESDLYALHQNRAILTGRDICTAIDLRENRMPAKKVAGMRKAISCGLEIRPSTDFASFFAVVNEGLEAKYGVQATHTADEMKRLHAAFPDNIILRLAIQNEKILGGALLYVCGPTLHAQYIAQNDVGMKHRCLDLMVHHIISTFTGFTWFSFGISSENKGQRTNTGLLNSKEEFMTSAICFDHYHLPAQANPTTQDR